MSGFANYILAILIDKNRDDYKGKLLLIAAVILNLSLLGYFKYYNFFIQNINSIFNTDIAFSSAGLPIGISFFTFKIISYLVDVYKQEVKAQYKFYKLLLFLSIYHQIMSGPIIRYKDMENDIDHKEITASDLCTGIDRFIFGLLKKVLIANTAGETASIFLESNLAEISVLGAWFGIIMYTLQIYFDFSGYSDMAIGLGRMFGFKYKENFNYPYIAKNAQDFWRRWHISLGSFFRDYVYIPLGGNRKHYIINLFIVWLLTGIWHGASWNFIFWGLYYGVFMLLEKKLLSNILKKLPGFISHIYLMIVVIIGWVLFYFVDISEGLKYISILFGLGENPLYDVKFEV
jgi:alginate O-acetyltransferase complex protein AlgI